MSCANAHDPLTGAARSPAQADAKPPPHICDCGNPAVRRFGSAWICKRCYEWDVVRKQPEPRRPQLTQPKPAPIPVFYADYPKTPAGIRRYRYDYLKEWRRRRAGGMYAQQETK